MSKHKVDFGIAGYLHSPDSNTISFPAEIESWFPGHVALEVGFDDENLPPDWTDKKVIVTIRLEDSVE